MTWAAIFILTASSLLLAFHVITMVRDLMQRYKTRNRHREIWKRVEDVS